MTTWFIFLNDGVTIFRMRLLILSALLLLSACATGPASVAVDDKTPLVLKAVKFTDLPGWGEDDLAEALPALQKSCARIAKGNPDKDFGPILEAKKMVNWQGICLDLARLDAGNNDGVRLFFERHFQPYEASAQGETEGLFTGYYEASLRGSRTKHGPYRYPLYTRPGDLVMVDLGEFRDELKGQRIAGRVNPEGQLKPYEDRAAIVGGKWPHNDKVLVWVDDAVDAFFVQVQGSGVVQLDDGGTMRIGYAGQNGHIYYAIGRELIKRGELTKDNVSMQAIREWLAANPDQADEIMNTNRSYVFFRELEGEGPLGGENVALTPERSLAIDRSKIPYGVPVWVDIEEPVPGTGKINRLMMAQDTGGAIRGAVRGDVFWGYGERAEAMAGPMKAKGRYWLLLPR
jgi:membrane-bound lytic murein transglycosylase A